MHPKLSIAYFITSHGFGHAARASAVMNAIYARWPYVSFEIFTLTPQWFFTNCVKAPFAWHQQQTDVGLVQTSPLHFDPDQTIDALAAFLPFKEQLLKSLSDKLCVADCHLIISDISPLGIAVAQYAGMASVLVENFTWDWIYEPYVTENPQFKKYIDLLDGYFNNAGLRIQAVPICKKISKHPCTPPISRAPVSDPLQIRKQLGIKGQEKMVLITMGGMPGSLPFIEQLASVDKHICFVLPGTSINQAEPAIKTNQVIFLSRNSEFYHPDLVNAADAVVGKVGYSTLSEVYQAGVPYGFVTRPDFRESPVFETYIRQNMAGIEISEIEFNSGVWLKLLPELLSHPKRAQSKPNGADAAAEHICNYFACEKEILEVVDTRGDVVGAAPRKCVHGNNALLHRVVHVLVYDKNNRLLLQKRSLNKRVAPGRWDTSVGGHVDCGESIRRACGLRRIH